MPRHHGVHLHLVPAPEYSESQDQGAAGLHEAREPGEHDPDNARGWVQEGRAY